MRALSEQDAAMLHESAALLALGAATDLMAVQNQVPGSVVQEAKHWPERFLLVVGAASRLDAEFSQCRGDDSMHAANPRLAAPLPRRPGGQSQRVSQFRVVNQRRSARGAPHPR